MGIAWTALRKCGAPSLFQCFAAARSCCAAWTMLTRAGRTSSHFRVFRPQSGLIQSCRSLRRRRASCSSSVISPTSGTRDAFLERTAWTDAHIVKGAIGAATSGSASAFLNQVGRDFIEFVRPQTIVGRLLYPRVIPWNTRTAYQTNGPAAAWTGEGTAIPALGPTYSKEDPMPVRKGAGGGRVLRRAFGAA